MRESPRRPWLPLALGILGLFLLIASEAGYLTSVENTFHYVLDPLQRLFSVKKRDGANPVLLIASNREHVTRFIGELSLRASACADEFWPGPLSMVLPANRSLPDAVVGPDGSFDSSEADGVDWFAFVHVQFLLACYLAG